MEGNRSPLLGGQSVERLRQVKTGLGLDPALAPPKATEALGERLEAVAPPVGRDAFIHGDSCEPRARVFVAQTTYQLRRLGECFMDRIFRQRLIAKDQASRS